MMMMKVQEEGRELRKGFWHFSMLHIVQGSDGARFMLCYK
jgi:hypothetical protein